VFNIEVDLNDLMNIRDELTPVLSALQQGVVNAAQFVRDVWVASVQGTMLPGMARAVNDDQYAKSLTTGEAMKFPAFLYGVVSPYNYSDGADRIEEGYGPFDMKPGLLNGPKSRQTADGQGRFNVVPFRHYTPSSNSAISIKMRMPTDIYSQAKRLNRSVPNPGGGVNWGQSLVEDSAPATSWTDYTHQSSIYNGMYRVGAEKQTQYLTFRRVSTPRMVNGKLKGSAPNSWIHPGLSPNPLIEAVYNYCMPQVEKNLLEIAQQAF